MVAGRWVSEDRLSLFRLSVVPAGGGGGSLEAVLLQTKYLPCRLFTHLSMSMSLLYMHAYMQLTVYACIYTILYYLLSGSPESSHVHKAVTQWSLRTGRLWGAAGGTRTGSLPPRRHL